MSVISFLISQNNPTEGKHLGNTGVLDMLILNCALQKKVEVMNWIQLAQDKQLTVVGSCENAKQY
jgi:hypothetical protein